MFAFELQNASFWRCRCKKCAPQRKQVKQTRNAAALCNRLFMVLGFGRLAGRGLFVCLFVVGAFIDWPSKAESAQISASSFRRVIDD